jgi:hypothetical protein
MIRIMEIIICGHIVQSCKIIAYFEICIFCVYARKVPLQALS